MINPTLPVFNTTHAMARDSPTLPKQNLTLNTLLVGGFSGLSPRPFKQFNMSPTSKHHFERLPHNVTAIDANDDDRVAEFLKPSSNSLIVDVRPFNMYSTLHLRSSVNICVPSTLLRRPKYDLGQVINASSLPAELKTAVMDESRSIQVLLYDSNSVDSQVSFQLYQTMHKFIVPGRFDLYYLRGGSDQVNSRFMEKGQALPMRSPMTLSGPNSDSSQERKDSVHSIDSSEGCPVLTGFSLPSATSSDNKLLMSIKKSLPQLDTSTSYSYKFTFPENFEQKMDKLPPWLSFFAEVYGKENSERLIVERFSDMFNRLEKTEQVRLRMAISNMDKDSQLCHDLDRNLHETDGYGTPLTMCPCCDKIDYNLPQGVENGYKNRYNNIWPYEHSRVRLISSPSCAHRKDMTDDYFNANYIAFKRLSQRRYIATQNPLDATEDDFWTTVWYNGVKSVVCLAAPPVFGKLTYYDYDHYLEKSKLNIRIDSCEKQDSFILRQITISKGGKSQTLYHFEYQKWPDFGTPDDLKSVFDLIAVKNQKLLPMTGVKPTPVRTADTWDVLVHCSAGCGRTGCYIAMDMIVDSFENSNENPRHYDPWGNEDLVYKLIQFQRQQRISMVQNLDQFIFCYEGILNYIVNNVIE